MKIGILTYHWVSNFGANLQALSTYCFLQNNGHTPIIINWIPSDLETYYVKNVTKAQNEVHKAFAKRHFLNITKRCETSQEIADIIREYQIDIVVIGSDAVFTYTPKICRWHLTRKGFVYSKPCIDSDFPNPYWGDFSKYLDKPIRVCAMSASAQNTNYKFIFDKKNFAKALSQFSFISVRDIWTHNMVRYLTDDAIVPQITPDPVFAFEQNVHPQISRAEILQKFNLNRKYVLISITDKTIDPNWIQQLSVVFNKEGVELVTLGQTNKQLICNLPHHINFPLDPLDWYGLIKYSNGYIGELMHPILVALHNATPVFVLDLYGFNKHNTLDILSSKTYQIMSKFDLLTNYYNKRMNLPIPLVDSVATKILNFDIDKCQRQATLMYQDYIKMMNKMILG